VGSAPRSSDGGPSPARRLDLAIGASLLGLTALVFGQVWAHDFVNYDDPLYVAENPMVGMGLSRASLAWALTTFHGGNWHPLTWLSFLIESAWFGPAPGVLHLTDVALHALNTLLLYALLRRLGGAVWRPALVAALFAVHPLHVESVAWISERKDVLSTAFGLLSLHAWVGFARRGGGWRYAACFAALACGLMAKAMLVTWPFVFLLLDYGPLARLPRAGSASVWLAGLGRRIAEKLPFFALSVLASLIAVVAQRTSGALVESLPFAPRVANAFLAYLWYLEKTIWPTALVPLRPHLAEAVPLWPALGALAALTAFTALLLGPLRRRRCLTVGWLFYLGTLVPVIGLVQVGSQATADRYGYVPLIGVFALLAWSLGAAVARWPRGRPLAVAGSAAALLALAVVAHAQTSHWRNSIALFGHALAVAPPNPASLVLYAKALEQTGRVEEAIPRYPEALALDPGFEYALIGLGIVWMQQQRPAEAIPLFKAAVAKRPDNEAALRLLGRARLATFDLDGALASFRRAVAIAPGSARAHEGVGLALLRKGRDAEARTHFEEALRLEPGLAQARRHLGEVRPTRSAE
jgi:tetratricopeptide (TPR) repeat protein